MALNQKPTNIQILSSVVDGMDTDVKDAVGYAISTGSTAILQRLSLENLKNIFVDSFNKFGKQVAFDVMGGWSNDLTTEFLRDANDMGEFTELISVNNDPAKNFANYNFGLGDSAKRIFKDYYPETASENIRIQKHLIWAQSLTKPELKKAMINQTGIYDTIYGLIIKTIQTKAQIYLYNYTKGLLTGIKKSYVLPEVAKGDANAAKQAYETILALNNKFSMPTTKYNERGFYSTTNRGDALLIMTNDFKASFDVNVMASLFNSSLIETNKNFRNIISADIETYDLFDEDDFGNGKKETFKTDVVGYLMDRDALREEITLDETMTQFDVFEAKLNYFHHVWLKAGLNKSMNAVKFTTYVEKPTVLAENGEVYASNDVINGKILYTDDGSDPTKDSNEFTNKESIEGVSGTTYKFVTYCQELDKMSEVVTVVIE